MSRECRRVPADWQHPIDERTGRPKPLFDDSYRNAVAEWKAGYAKWQAGERASYCTSDDEYWDWNGPPPERDDYRPDWSDAERTHYQMYETCSEGTPISPVFATPEEVARWCADNNASAFGGMTATYEQWLAVAKGAWAPSMMAVGGKLMSGVEFAGQQTQS